MIIKIENLTITEDDLLNEDLITALCILLKVKREIKSPNNS